MELVKGRPADTNGREEKEIRIKKNASNCSARFQWRESISLDSE